jgi:hypothetical protein
VIHPVGGLRPTIQVSDFHNCQNLGFLPAVDLMSGVVPIYVLSWASRFYSTQFKTFFTVDDREQMTTVQKWSALMRKRASARDRMKWDFKIMTSF